MLLMAFDKKKVLCGSSSGVGHGFYGRTAVWEARVHC